MKVFISWSGGLSRAVGEILKEWLKCTLQATQPWMSSQDIDRGSLWFNAINDQLKDVGIGIVCLTRENKDRPWILFEAGALAKGLSSTRVCTLLIDLTPGDIEDPLAQFQHTAPTKEGIWRLLETLNALTADHALEAKHLREVFDTFWPKFEQKFKQALKENPPGKAPEPRTEASVLGEILESTRSISQRLGRLESAQEPAIAAPYVSGTYAPAGWAAALGRVIRPPNSLEDINREMHKWQLDPNPERTKNPPAKPAG